jgi:flagellar hook-basal body complex protein FliE
MDEIKIDGRQQAITDKIDGTKHQGNNGFAEVIKKAVNNAGNMEKEADMSVMNLLKGKAEIHETMIAMQKSDISMRLMLTIRNKAIEAYKEIMHMQF